MSDIEKVVSYAKMLGSATPIQLRWEAAGDAQHAIDLLSELQTKTLRKNEAIAYHATINLYEKDTSPIYKKAKEGLEAIHAGCFDDQTFTLTAGSDVTRANGALGQNKAHIMFVRNVMIVGANNSSETHNSEGLLTLHKNAVRNRSGSISNGGALRLGMSGSPGLAESTQRANLVARNLFVGADQIMAEAEKDTRFSNPGLMNTVGKNDADFGYVMKNNGDGLTPRNTYYMTFQFAKTV